MPALATMYADERAEHDEDRKRMAYLELQVADLKQQLYEERRWQN